MFAINPQLDSDRLRREFHNSGRLKCEPFLEHRGASILLECLKRNVQWITLLSRNQRVLEVTGPGGGELNHAQRAEAVGQAYAAEANGFSFCYETNRRSPAADELQTRGAPLPSILQEWVSFLNSLPTLEMFRCITGVNNLSWANVQASRYQPGHFLGLHDDSADPNRRIAYVLNLTQTWSPAWGGLLQFLAADNGISQTYVPQFNALHLFRVPQPHMVSLVCPFARRARYAVSGWFHAQS